jgi:hypothetical protein
VLERTISINTVGDCYRQGGKGSNKTWDRRTIRDERAWNRGTYYSGLDILAPHICEVKEPDVRNGSPIKTLLLVLALIFPVVSKTSTPFILQCLFLKTRRTQRSARPLYLPQDCLVTLSGLDGLSHG